MNIQDELNNQLGMLTVLSSNLGYTVVDMIILTQLYQGRSFTAEDIANIVNRLMIRACIGANTTFGTTARHIKSRIQYIRNHAYQFQINSVKTGRVMSYSIIDNGANGIVNAFRLQEGPVKDAVMKSFHNFIDLVNAI